MNLNQDLEEHFIEQQYSENLSIDKEQLCVLFDNSKVHSGKSLESLKKLGGVQGLQKQLNINKSFGINSLDQVDINRRKNKYGDNVTKQKEQTSIWELITEQFEDKILQILIAAAVVALIVGISTKPFLEGILEGVGIMFAIVVIVTVTAGNNYMKDKQFQNLYKQSKVRYVQVLRDGKLESLHVDSLLVGDLMTFETGEIFCVDGVLVEANDVFINEADMTGESDDIRKTVPKDYSKEENANCFVISGTKCMEGSGMILVCAVGSNSVQGKLRETLTEEQDETPLQGKLSNMADDIGIMGTRAAVLTFIAMVVHLLIEKYNNGEEILTVMTFKSFLNFFMIAISVIVCAVPEGLPLAVTIALAYSVGKMYEEKNLVRYLSACETMGGVNNICSDKTGTLTMNKMSVKQLFTEDCIHTKIQKENITEKVQSLLCEGICYNSNANPEIESNGNFVHLGNKTECALLQMTYQQFGVDYRTYRNSAKIQKIFPFNYKLKHMMSVVETNNPTMYRVYVKGAPEFIISKCTKYFGQHGDIEKLNEEVRTKIQEKIILSFANQSLRTLLLAYKDIEKSKYTQMVNTKNFSEIDQDLTFISIVGIKDPLREEIPAAIKQCHESGITVRMVTGDNINTAIAISKDAGILPRNFDSTQKSMQVMDGEQFSEYVGGLIPADKENGEPAKVGDLQAFEVVSKELKVLARSNPDHKYLLVTGLKQLNNVVAVTGDGTNDAPALKKADIGFAMGIAGTEVAKEAAGIILLDDNFKSIITAIKWGRNIFDSIRKFLQFQLTVNIVAVFMVFFGAVVLRESPLNVIQMLWVNLIMDTFASLALATDAPTEDLLKRKPYGRDEYMVTPYMWRNIIVQSIYQIIILIVILLKGELIFNVPSSRQLVEWDMENGVHYTIFFNIFIFMQVFNEVNCRKLSKFEVNPFSGFFENKIFVFVLIVTILTQYSLVQYGGILVQCAPLTINQHILCIVFGVSGIFVGILIKFIPESIFDKFTLFQDRNVDPDDYLHETFVEKMRKPNKQRSIMRTKSFGTQKSMGGFKVIQ